MAKTVTPTPGTPAPTPGKPAPSAPKGRLPEAQPAEEFGLTDGLDHWVERFGERTGLGGLDRLLDAVDRRATVRVSADSIEVRGVVRHRSINLDHLRGVELRTPMAVLGNVVPHWQKLLWVVPGARLGRLVRLAGAVGPRLLHKAEDVDPDELDRPVVAALRRVGPTYVLRGAPALVALVNPRLTERIVEEAQRRSVPVRAKA